MRKLLIIIFLIVCTFATNTLFGENLPVLGIKPSGTLPCLYINTTDSLPIVSKETYITGTYWLDASMQDSTMSLGSSETPLKLEIRGRGNATWNHDGQKPYKIKLDKKANLLGMGKNKHWALLAKYNYMMLHNEALGFELSRRMGMPWTPQFQPVEVVLNGNFIGLYMLTETVRVDNNRVDIQPQDDLNEDSTTVANGWLVEIDNYSEDNQVRLKLPDNSILRITPHTPEMLSDLQHEYLTNQFTDIVNTVYTDNKLDNRWEEYIDIESLARFYVFQEIIHNMDAFVGSCYLYKNDGDKWQFGPVWDLSWSLERYKPTLLADATHQNLISDIYKFPNFRIKVKEYFEAFLANIGDKWLESFLEPYHKRIQKAATASLKVWPYQTDLGPNSTAHLYVYDCYRQNVKYLRKRFGNDCQTFLLSHSSVTNNRADTVTAKAYNVEYFDSVSYAKGNTLLLNGLHINNCRVLPGMQIEVSVDTAEDCVLDSLYLNETDITDQVVDGKLIITVPNSDLHLNAVFTQASMNAVDDIAIDQNHSTVSFKIEGHTVSFSSIDKAQVIDVYDICGHLIRHVESSGDTRSIQIPTKGLYILKIGDKTCKIRILD